MAEFNPARNTADIRAVELRPVSLRDFTRAAQKTTLFGREHASPFGIAPVGLQGLMWPRSCEILARAAAHHRIPFVLSTVTTASIETVAAIRSWESCRRGSGGRSSRLAAKRSRNCAGGWPENVGPPLFKRERSTSRRTPRA